MTRRDLLVSVVVVAVLGAGCGVRPSDVITGRPAPTVAVADRRPGAPPPSAALYFLAGSALTAVLRPTGRPVSPTQALVLLQDGPDGDDRAADLTSEVPTGLGPVSVTTDASGNVQVVVTADVTTLSPAAVDQIVCTVGDALSSTAPTTLSSAAATRGPRVCPLAGG